MTDLTTGDRTTIEIEILDGGDQNTVRFRLAGILDPQDVYEIPRQTLQLHIQRARQQRDDLEALAQEDTGAPF